MPPIGPMVQTVTKKGKTNEASMQYIVKETLRHVIPLGEGEQCVFTADWPPTHMHVSVALAFKNANLWLYITAPNCNPYIQACDKKKINGAFKSSLEENYAEWVEDKVMGKKRKRGPVPVPSREETTTWVLEAFDAITEDDIRAVCRAAYFPKGMKLSELEDLKYFANSDSDSSLILILIPGRTPMTVVPFLSLPQVMIPTTPMMSPLKLFGLRLSKACGEWPMSLMGSCILQGTTCKAISFPRIPSCPSPNQPLSLSQRHLQVVSMCNCSAWCMIARRVSKPNICRLRILHCLCQHLCKPEIFMFPRISCVCIHLVMWAEVKVHSYHARAHVCVGSCMCCA